MAWILAKTSGLVNTCNCRHNRELHPKKWAGEDNSLRLVSEENRLSFSCISSVMEKPYCANNVKTVVIKIKLNSNNRITFEIKKSSSCSVICQLGLWPAQVSSYTLFKCSAKNDIITKGINFNGVKSSMHVRFKFGTWSSSTAPLEQSQTQCHWQ